MSRRPAGARQPSKIVILDLGSQYTQFIARRVREGRVCSEILPHDIRAEEIRRCGAQGIIFIEDRRGSAPVAVGVAGAHFRAHH